MRTCVFFAMFVLMALTVGCQTTGTGSTGGSSQTDDSGTY
ncbi:uncharacterized protein METZ01_LOCUS282593 [marine metagenome]|uniref:Uncharacterized protein n=1 Tax=marine metagenome TaxID=408172 RepID=A0A382KZI2_9ZZZZ